MTRDVPMFEVASAPPPELSVMHAVHASTAGVYTKYRPKQRVACDECIAVLHENRGRGQPPLGARWTRRAAKTLRLCGPHCDLWRKRDGKG